MNKNSDNEYITIDFEPLTVRTLKAKNRRVQIAKVKHPDNGRIYFFVRTKRLVSFKDRAIRKNETLYTPETFMLVFEGMNHLVYSNLEEMKDLNKGVSAKIEIYNKK